MASRIPKETIKKILVVRADNIGDWVLTTPTVSLLKDEFPEAEIAVLGRRYVQKVIEACPYVDQFEDYDALSKSQDPSSDLAAQHYDLAIVISKSRDVARWIKGAKIPYRIGAINRRYCWSTCNFLPRCSRRKEYPHEAQKATQFLKPLGITPSFSVAELRKRIAIEPKGDLPSHLEETLTSTKFNLILHPGSNNHGREWPASYFAELIRRLPKEKFNVMVTGSAKEDERFRLQLPEGQYINLMGKTSLDELLLLLNRVDGLVSAGTGAAHLAAALGVHTLGLFPSKFKIGPKAWQPLGPKATFLQDKESCLKPCSDGNCVCMARLATDQIYNTVVAWAADR